MTSVVTLILNWLPQPLVRLVAVNPLMPEHEHLEAWHFDRRFDYLQRGIAAHQPRRHHRHQVGACQYRTEKQEVRHGQSDLLHHAQFS